MFDRRIATGWVALGVFTVGMTVAGLEASNSPLSAPYAASQASPVSQVGSAPVAPQNAIHAVQASRYWWLQDGAACVPMSARVVIGVETGNVVSAADIRATAARVSGFDADGTDWATTPNILAAYGVTSHTVADASLDTLRASLDAGHAPMVVIDPNAVWTFLGLEGTPGEQHAVVVAGIDDARHVVTLVDSAWDGGMAETVPAATFLTSWDAVSDSALLVG